MTEPRLRDRDSRQVDPPDGEVYTDSEGSYADELSIVGLPEIDLFVLHVGCKPSSSQSFEIGSFSSRCRLRMATFSSGVWCFRCFFMRSLLYPTGRTPSPFPTEPEHNVQLQT